MEIKPLKWDNFNDQKEPEPEEWGQVKKVSDEILYKIKRESKQFIDGIDIRELPIGNQTRQILKRMGDFELPKPNMQLRIRTQSQLNLILVVLKIIEKHKTIDEATVSTFTLNKEAWAVFMRLVDENKIKKLNLIIASSYAFRVPKEYEQFKTDSKIRNNVRLIFAWSHLKISLFKCKKNYYQVEGSMNYSQNNMAEQILVENNKATYDYDYDFLNNIMTSVKQSLEIVK